MAQVKIKELFYSNGVDIFGPVSIEDFSKNRYYKSTLVWYEGLTGWTSIEECKDLKHLIGTLSTPILNSGLPQALPNLTPPLSKKTGKSATGKWANTIILSLVLMAILLLTFSYINNKPAAQVLQDEHLSDTFMHDSSIAEESEIARTARLEAEMKTYRMNWEKFITAAPNDFRRKDIGGIEDLKVIIKNNSPYHLDSVTVKVIYIKANGDPYQTEIIQFDNITPDNTKELFAPNSNRGVKVNCSIIAIASKAMNLCLDKRDKQFVKKTGEDPFKCN